MVTIKLFAVLKKLAGKDEFQVDVKGGMPLKEFVSCLNGNAPEIAELITKKKVLVSVNQEVAHEETVVKEGDEVAILPPFSGGGESGGMVRVQKEDFSVDAEIARVKASSTRIGGIVVFLGVARDYSKGREVQGITFEHYKGMAEKKLTEIRERALADFDIIEASLVHRVGDLTIGDNIVLVVAGAEHRGDAFKAAKWCIDELKQITPIWKMETTPQGERWVEWHP